MRRAQSLVITISAVAIIISLFAIAGAVGRPRAYAMSRFRVVVDRSISWPDFSGAEGKALSAFLNRPENLLILAKTSGTPEKSFALEEIRNVRSTSFVSIQYSGGDSSSVQSVASNAAILAVRFCVTNKPAWEVSYLDTFPFEPRSLLENAYDFVWRYVSRIFLQ